MSFYYLILRLRLFTPSRRQYVDYKIMNVSVLNERELRVLYQQFEGTITYMLMSMFFFDLIRGLSLL